MVAKSNMCYQDLHAAEGNVVHVLSPPAPTGMTLADRLRTVPLWVMEVATYCIHLGATSSMATAQLWLGEDLIVVKPGFLGETSYRQCENLIGEFSAMGDGVLAMVDVEDIICSHHSYGLARLAFDLRVFSHFHMFEYGINDDDSLGVNIYSSKTRAWIFKKSKWGKGIVVSTYGKGEIVNGFMHMLEFTQIVVDMEGKTWRKIRRPTSHAISIHEAQGQLCLCTTDTLYRYELSIWILEDYGTSKWTLKHKVTTLELFGKKNIEIGTEVCDVAYRVIVVHPEWILSFLVGEDKTLLAYDMNRCKVHVLPAQAIGYPRST
ncbi:uncharacterized protein [Miscanthus floridulus]|uniref:uncharacterized protein n=1 Tax=Miscanthus floridulus TaxID=154761 RepID=UPI003458ABC3